MAKRMKSELQLTDKQTEEIKTFFSSYHRERQKEFDKSKKAGQDREARRAAMVKNRAAMDDKIKSVLTEEQYKKYKENEEKRRGEAAQRGQRMRGEGRPNR